MTDSAHLGLPYIEGAQAQKHVTHNEALAILDALVMLAVIDRDLSAPPPDPAEGDRYLVKAPGSGDFSGKDDQIAHYADGGWSFLAPAKGWTCYVEDEARLVAFDGVSWEAVGEGGGSITELQNLTRLGLGTTADATNPFAAKLNNALWTAKSVAEGGDGDLRYKLSKESAADTLSLLFQDNYSGRAEIGLTGDDDFHFKVSADGTNWINALLLDRATGAAKLQAGFVLQGVLTPPQITSDQDDYDPTGLASASVLRLSSDASRNITGLAGGSNGCLLLIHNVGSQALVLRDESTSSIATNRFALTADLALSPDAVALLQYDGTSARWRAVAGGGGSGVSQSGASQRNHIVNPNGLIWQVQNTASAAVTDGAYCFDQWYALTQSAGVTASQLTDLEDGTPYGMRLTQADASAQRFGLAQAIEVRDCKDMRGREVTLSARVRMSQSATLRFAILEWTGTADSPTRDVVSDWTSASFTAGGFFLGTNLVATAVGSIALAANTLTDIALSSTCGSALNNAIVLFWTDTTQAQNTTLDVAKVKFEKSASASAFVDLGVAHELTRCQRFYEKTYDLTVAPGTATSTGGTIWSYLGTNTIADSLVYGTVRYATNKRVAGTVTVYGYAGGSGKVSNTSGADLAANSGGVAQSGQSGFTPWNNSGGPVTTTGFTVLYHWVADARFA